MNYGFQVSPLPFQNGVHDDKSSTAANLTNIVVRLDETIDDEYVVLEAT
jgi:hypothetical protein